MVTVRAEVYVNDVLRELGDDEVTAEYNRRFNKNKVNDLSSARVHLWSADGLAEDIRIAYLGVW